MAITYEEMKPSLIANAAVKKGLLNGVHKLYDLNANKGYVLHDNMLDEGVIDPDTLEPTGKIKKGYYTGTRSVRYDYDFTTNPREFYAVLENSVPSDQIFNVPSGDHEIM
jgi:hypothetical protein